MKYTFTVYKTYLQPLLVCFFLILMLSCANAKPTTTYDTVEEAEKAILKQRRNDEKLAKKAVEESKKRHWDNQTKKAKQSIHENEKRMKKNKKNGRFIP